MNTQYGSPSIRMDSLNPSRTFGRIIQSIRAASSDRPLSSQPTNLVYRKPCQAV